MLEALDVDQAASRLGMSRAAVVRRVNDGDIAATRVGNRIRIAAAEVERYRQSLMVAMAHDDQEGIEDDLARREEQMRAFERLREADDALGWTTALYLWGPPQWNSDDFCHSVAIESISGSATTAQ